MANEMRDRLVELLFKPFTQYKINELSDTGDIADHLIESGVIVPPCKVGDTVYEFFDVKGFYSINELIVENIVIGMNPPKCNIHTKSKFGNSRNVYHQESFGKILFFTKEKAEEVERWHLEQP